MYRFLFRPKWLGFHLLVVVGVVVMINLGFWQLRRLDERRDFNATIETRFDAPPVPLDDLIGDVVDPADARLDEVEWRPVTVSGTYQPDATLLIVNRSQSGRAGDNTVTPLRLADGRLLLVNRGFVPLSSQAPPPPTGEVSLVGHLHDSEVRRTGQLSDPDQGALDIAQRIDIERLAPQLDGEVVPVYVDLLASQPPEPGPYPEAVLRPDLSEGNHLSYAVQWFLFSAAVAVGWVLAVRHSVTTRRRATTAD